MQKTQHILTNNTEKIQTAQKTHTKKHKTNKNKKNKKH